MYKLYFIKIKNICFFNVNSIKKTIYISKPNTFIVSLSQTYLNTIISTKKVISWIRIFDIIMSKWNKDF
jgi:hypothetical protein